MKLTNQAKVGLVTAACLLLQGYCFTYVLGVEPPLIVSIAPLLPYILYIYARNRRVWNFDRTYCWIVGIVALTIIDVAIYL
jgi:cytochrome c oxidase assembly factor CtaG